MTVFLDSRVLPHRQIHCALLSPRLEIRNKSPKAPKTNAAGRFHRRLGQERPGAMLARAVLESQGVVAALAWRLGRHRTKRLPRGLRAGLPEGVGAPQGSATGVVERGQSCRPLAPLRRSLLSAARLPPFPAAGQARDAKSET